MNIARILSVTALGCLLINPNAVAQQQDGVQQDRPSVCYMLPRDEAQGAGQKVKVRTADEQIVEGEVVGQQQPPVAGANYQAGVDAYGKPVVPADVDRALSRNPIGEKDKLRIPLEMDLAQRILTLQNADITMKAPLGMLEIYKDGRVEYQGEDWSQPIYNLCGRHYSKVTVNDDEPIVVTTEPEAPVDPQVVKEDIQKAIDAPAVPQTKEVQYPGDVMHTQPKAVEKPSIEPVEMMIPKKVPTKVVTDKPELIQGGAHR